MKRFPAFVLGGLFLVAFAPAGLIPLPQELAYRLPSPPTATYHVSDTTRVAIGTPAGELEGRGTSSFTIAATFERVGEGLRVSGELTAFEGQSTDPMGGTTSLSRSSAGAGDLELMLGPEGVAEVVSGTLRSSGGALPIFADPYEVMFPRLAGGEVVPGATWVDGLTNYVGSGSEAERAADYTYTLVGDTVVDERRHLRIDFVADVRLTTLGAGSGMPPTMNGTETGFFLWDVGRGLPTWTEVVRSYEGATEVPGEGRVRFTIDAVTRSTLAGGRVGGRARPRPAWPPGARNRVTLASRNQRSPTPEQVSRP